MCTMDTRHSLRLGRFFRRRTSQWHKLKSTICQSTAHQGPGIEWNRKVKWVKWKRNRRNTRPTYHIDWYALTDKLWMIMIASMLCQFIGLSIEDAVDNGRTNKKTGSPRIESVCFGQARTNSTSSHGESCPEETFFYLYLVIKQCVEILIIIHRYASPNTNGK